MKRTEIPAVKCFTFLDKGVPELSCVTADRRISVDVPCILRTAAADKLILDVVRAAKGWANSEYDAGIVLGDAVQRLENAGVKL